MKKVLVCTGRFGDLYQICKAATEPCIVFTSQQFSPIVKELFPEHQLFIVGKTMSGISEMMDLAKTRFPDHEIIPAQQNGMPLQIQAEFRNYEEYQKWQVSQTKSLSQEYTPKQFSKAIVYLDGVSSGIYEPMYANIKRNIIQGCRAMGLNVVEYQSKMDGFKQLEIDMNQPDTVLITNDSLPYHLCNQSPVIVISRSIQWAQSTPKPNCIGRLTQEMIDNDYSELVAMIGRNKPMRQFHNHKEANTILAYSDYTPNDISVLGRHAMATASWAKLNSVDYHVLFCPLQSEGLPFVGDVLKNAILECRHPDDIVIVLNKDICLVPESVGILRAFMDSRNIDECYSHRVDVEFKNHLNFVDLKMDAHIWGIDFFAFRPSSKVIKKLIRTPLYIGRTDWDNYWASIVKNRLPYNISYHYPHISDWKLEDGVIGEQNRHNQTKIMEAMPELMFYDKIGFVGFGPIS